MAVSSSYSVMVLCQLLLLELIARVKSSKKDKSDTVRLSFTDIGMIDEGDGDRIGSSFWNWDDFNYYGMF